MSPHLTGLNWLNDDKHSPCQLSRVTGVKVCFFFLVFFSSRYSAVLIRREPTLPVASVQPCCKEGKKKIFFCSASPQTDGRTDGHTNGEPGEVKCASDREAS